MAVASTGLRVAVRTAGAAVAVAVAVGSAVLEYAVGVGGGTTGVEGVHPERIAASTAITAADGLQNEYGRNSEVRLTVLGGAFIAVWVSFDRTSGRDQFYHVDAYTLILIRIPLASPVVPALEECSSPALPFFCPVSAHNPAQFAPFSRRTCLFGMGR